MLPKVTKYRFSQLKCPCLAKNAPFHLKYIYPSQVVAPAEAAAVEKAKEMETDDGTLESRQKQVRKFLSLSLLISAQWLDNSTLVKTQLML